MKLVFRFLVLTFLFIVSFKFSVKAIDFGSISLKYLEQISRIPRVAFTEGELASADYLGRILRDLGYDVNFEEVSFPDDVPLNFVQGYYLSHNIIATKKGLSDLEVVIGASYDSYDSSGCMGFESATGVALLIEMANLVKDIDFPYTIKFVLFGAGKPDSIGSTHYVSTRSQNELNNIMFFLNLSCIGSGENLYFYSNKSQKGFLRDEFLELAKILKIPLFTSPSMEEDSIPEGVGYDIGDQVPFKYSNVPYGFLEATSWESIDGDFKIPDDPTGVGNGIIEGSSSDNYGEVMEVFGDVVEKNLYNASKLIYNFLVKDKKSIKVVNIIKDENLEKVSDISYTLIKDGKSLKKSSLDDNLVVKFDNLDKGIYKIKVNAPSDIEFIKDIEDMEFNLNCDGEFTIVNDEVETYTYRKEFTETYTSIRKEIQNTQFPVRVKKLLIDYSSVSGGSKEEEQGNNEDFTIKLLSVTLGVLVFSYIVFRIILSNSNRKIKK